MNTLPENPAGFWLSPKLDGCRVIFTGEHFQSRNGNIFPAPAHWFKGMPRCRLDGELWMGNGTFPDLVGTIQRRGSNWEDVRFMVFDIAEMENPIETRLATLSRLSLPSHVGIVPQRVCTGWDDLNETESQVVANGGEGLCLRAPQSYYKPSNFIKVKRLFPDLNRSVLD